MRYSARSTSARAGPGRRCERDVKVSFAQPARPLTSEEFQAMIPAHFLGTARPARPASPVERGVRVTVQRPAPAPALLPPPPSAPGRVTETITKSTFTETTVTRVTDNRLVEPLITEVRPRPVIILYTYRTSRWWTARRYK